MFIVGGKEAEQGTVSVRRHGVGDRGAMSLDDAVAMVNREIKTKGLEAAQ